MSSTLILGGARSGKSRYAEGLASGQKFYIATAEALDDEMRARIATHQAQRGADWTTVSAPLDMAAAIASVDREGRFVLVDCLTIWIGNLMHHGRDVRGEVAAFCAALKTMSARVAVVSNEVGMGIVPDNALARAFRDEHGFANQRVAEAADEVILVVAGLPIVLKKPAQTQPR